VVVEAWSVSAAEGEATKWSPSFLPRVSWLFVAGLVTGFAVAAEEWMGATLLLHAGDPVPERGCLVVVSY
jgi:hypothetical protein